MTTTSRHRHEERQPSIMNASPWLRKPLWYLEHEIREQDHQHLITDPQINDKTNNADLENSHNSCANSSQLHRHLNLFDLVSIGVGGTSKRCWARVDILFRNFYLIFSFFLCHSRIRNFCSFGPYCT